MPYKDPEEKREYMRLYMRDRRTQEKAEEEARIEKLKLGHVENILFYEYLSGVFSDEAVPDQRVIYRTPYGVDIIERFRPTLRKRTVNIVGVARVTVGSVPDSWAPHIKSVMERTKKKRSLVEKGSGQLIGHATTKVSEAMVIRDFKVLMKNTREELLNREWLTRFDFLFEVYRQRISFEGLSRDDAKFEWKRMKEHQADSEKALQDFIIEAVIDKKTDEQIIHESKADEKTREFYVRHFMPEYHAKTLIEEIRRSLPLTT